MGTREYIIDTVVYSNLFCIGLQWRNVVRRRLDIASSSSEANVTQVDKLVTIATPETAEEAEQIKCALEEEGVDVVVVEGKRTGLGKWFSRGAPQTHLQVVQSKSAFASLLLAKISAAGNWDSQKQTRRKPK